MLTRHLDAGILVSGLIIGGNNMIRFLLKYAVLTSMFIFTTVYINVDWWNEDSRRPFMLILCYVASFGVATVSYLEKGDWLRWRQ